MNSNFSTRVQCLLMLIGLLLAQSCGSPKPVSKSNRSLTTSIKRTSSNEIDASRRKIIDCASKYLGAKYQYGGKDARGFDCSGLISKVFHENKIEIKGSSSGLSKQGKTKTLKSVQAGDLVFFKKGERVNHVALITEINENELWVIHSTSSRGVIKENILASSYWSSKKYFFKDLL